jgi:hypothetical protein
MELTLLSELFLSSGHFDKNVKPVQLAANKLGGGFCCFSKLDQLSPQDHRWTKQM